ncbi:hypothetical protein B0H63DRAFT_191557 [Podospora didyma]|uniref:Uncharacterized protein n=1 Tax=Podospora didyma TaxID=330526 RepID=A0AAE0U040_9PEZI|nr:hypothetical protein B0H63DRAFT_191557 [Podospora didyma]
MVPPDRHTPRQSVLSASQPWYEREDQCRLLMHRKNRRLRSGSIPIATLRYWEVTHFGCNRLCFFSLFCHALVFACPAQPKSAQLVSLSTCFSALAPPFLYFLIGVFFFIFGDYVYFGAYGYSSSEGRTELNGKGFGSTFWDIIFLVTPHTPIIHLLCFYFWSVSSWAIHRKGRIIWKEIRKLGRFYIFYSLHTWERGKLSAGRLRGKNKHPNQLERKDYFYNLKTL